MTRILPLIASGLAAVALLAAALAGAASALRRRTQLQLPAGSELQLLEQLGQLAVRWADKPGARPQAEELLDILGIHMDKAEAKLPPALRSDPPAAPPRPRLVRPGELAVLLLLLASSACSPALRGALLACAAAEISPAVSAAAELALHEGEGWQAHLARLVASYGECAVRAAVRAAADRPVEPTATTLLAAPDSPVSPEEVRARARAWLGSRR